MNILVPDVTIVEKVLRAGDLVVLLMIGNDNSLAGGIIGAVTILVQSSRAACHGVGHVSVVTRRPAGE
mgnify:CR=1 FL=1